MPADESADPEGSHPAARGGLPPEGPVSDGPSSDGPPLAQSPWAAFDSILPVALFIGFNRFFGLPWAIAAATLWSVKAGYSRRRQGLPVGRFLPIITVLIVGRGLIGIITDSEAVYFGLGIATKFAIGLALVISVLIGRSLAAYGAPYVFGFDEETQRHPIYRSTMAHITLVGAVYYFISATFDIWLYRDGSVDRYLIVRTLVNWPFSTAAIVGSALYANRRMKAIPGLGSLMDRFEERMIAQQEAFGWTVDKEIDEN